MITDSTPLFVWSQFFISLVIHILWLNLNMLSIPFMLLFTNFQYIKNGGFIPTCDKSILFIWFVQFLNSATWMTTVSIFLYSYFTTDEDEP